MYRATFSMAQGGVKCYNPPGVHPAELRPFIKALPLMKGSLTCWDAMGCPRKLPGNRAHHSQMLLHLVTYLDLSCSPRISDRARFMCRKILSHYQPGQIATPRDLALSQLVAMIRRIN